MYLCDHIRPPLSSSSLLTLSALLIAMILFSFCQDNHGSKDCQDNYGSNQVLCIYWCFFLKQTSCSSSFLNFLCSLFPRLSLSLVSNLTFFLDLKPTENASFCFMS